MEEDKEQRKQKLSNLEKIDNPIVKEALSRRKHQFSFNYGDYGDAHRHTEEGYSATNGVSLYSDEGPTFTPDNDHIDMGPMYSDGIRW